MAWWRPGLAVAVALGVTGALWAVQDRSYRERLAVETEVTAEQTAKRLGDWIADRMNLSAYLAEKWADDYADNTTRFVGDAGQFVERFPGFQALNWIDPEGVIRIVVPYEENQGALNVQLANHPNPAVPTALRDATLTRHLTRTPAFIDLLQGGKGFATYRPIYNDEGVLLGYINAVFRVNALVETCLNRLRVSKQFQFAIRESTGELVYPTGEEPAFLASPDTVAVRVDVADQPWEFYVAPTPAYLRERAAWVHHLLIPAGLLVALTLVLLERAIWYRSRALHATQAQYRDLFEEAPVAYFSINPDGSIDRANRGAEAITGIPKERLVGMSVNEIYADTPSGLPHARRILDSVRKGELVRGVELEMRRADGATLWVLQSVHGVYDENRRLAHFRFTVTDITDRRNAEAARARLSAAIEQSEEGVVILEPDGAIVYVNSAFRAINADAASDAHGVRIQDLLRQEAVEEEVLASLDTALAEGLRWQRAYTLAREGGGERHIVCALSPVHDDSGRLINFALIQRDVSHEVKLQDQLRQAQKMESIGRLAGGIAHDFNNILQSLLGYATLAKEQLHDPEEAAQCLEEIERAGRRAVDLVAQILAFGRKSDNALQTVSLRLVVHEVADLLRGSLPEHIALSVTEEDTEYYIRADATKLHQIMMNLASNAVRAMQEGGGTLSMDLHAERLDEVSAAKIPPLRPGPHMRLTISDTGMGMDEKTLERIFEPYFTTRHGGDGTGLGLATVHSLVAQHDGAIHAASVPGEGSVFTLYFPAIDATAVTENASALKVEAPPTEAAAGGGNVLFVDDEVSIVESMSRLLHGHGFTVHGFTRAPDALAAFRVDPAAFDVLVTDFTMPEMNGLELATEIRAIRDTLPVVLCSGYGDEKGKALREEESAFQYYLKKPVTARALVRVILEATGNGAGHG